MGIELAWDKFFDYLLYQKKYSKYTIISYEDDFKLYDEFLNREGLDYLKVEYQDIKIFFNFLDEKKLSKASVSRIVSSLRTFYKYLARNNYMSYNPFELVSSPKKDKKLPKFLYDNELDDLFSIPKLDDPYGVRDRLILEMLYSTGMRVSELVNVKISDIDLVSKKIKVLGKGNKERIVFFNNNTLDILDLFINTYRPMLLKKEIPYLFINNKGGALTTRGVRVIIDKIINLSTVKTKISPHTLRHTFATHLLNNGCDILTVEELLGHASLKATQIYTHITNDHLKDVYLHAFPRANKKIDDNK